MKFSLSSFNDHPYVIMGIVNTTPDSFSDGGQNLKVEHAIKNVKKMISEGAHIIDIGGESTRPGAPEISVEEEIKRITPIIKAIREFSDIPISIDTRKSQVAKEAITYGANIINDISACTHDEGMINVAKEFMVPLIIMHMQGNPQNMQEKPQYEQVTLEITSFLKDRVTTITKAGIPANEIIIDPGIGFGKTYEHNLQILKELEYLMGFEQEMLIGVSRKSMFKTMLNAEVDNRVSGTSAVNIWAWQKGVKYFRVHDVMACNHSLKTYQTLTGR